MKKEAIQQAFEGRWRFKKGNLPLDSLKYESIAERVKDLCRDFFEAGILLADTQCQTVHPSEIPPTTVIDADTASNDFGLFWNAYDKKVGRPKCEKLWAKLTLKEKQDCLDYIPLYKQAQPDKQYRKNPETFLRNKSFYDEIIIRDNKQQQRQQRLAEAAELVAKYGK